MLNIAISALLSFAVTAVMGPVMIPMLRRLKFGQSIKDIGPAWHKNKNGTPTMGGIMFIAGVIVAVALTAFFWAEQKDFKVIATVIACLIFGIIGFVDDFIKVVKKRNLGLTAIQKLILQFLTAGTYVFYLASNGHISTKLQIPFVENPLELGWFYYIISVIVIVFVVNAVNLTDGVDGLAASVTLPPMICFCIIALNMNAVGICSASAAVLGGCAGFLIYNFNPAKVFMGDTGSLFLGGAMALIPFALNKPLLVIVTAFVFICEALSVVIQVSVFKLTKKRVFKMSPIHHHFEMCGWKETKIVYIFTAISALFSLIGYILF